jgi:hypothetical protein
MSFSYSGDPESSGLDFVRSEIGDTVESDALLQDEEILSAIKRQPSLYLAAAKCADKISALFARDINVRGDDMAADAGERYRHYKELALSLRAEARRGGSRSVVGRIHLR